MPKLNTTKTYVDGQPPVQSDLDNIIDDIEILLNITKLDDDNFLDSGITASTKVVAGSIQSTQIRNDAVTTVKVLDANVSGDKIAASAVTTAKILDDAVTEIKATELSGKMPVGVVTYFHTYAGAASIPRGWMQCNGDVIDTTNYEATHGGGTYTTDDVTSSAIDGLYLPDMATTNGRFAAGVDATPQDGSAPITKVGIDDHILALSHYHTNPHTHEIGMTTRAGWESAGYTSVTGLGGGTSVVTTTSQSNSTLSTELSNTLDIQPEAIDVITIMKVV